MDGYRRDRFPHWNSQGGGCDTRKRVLIRDGRNVRVGSGCRIISGTWRSYYDGLTVTGASRVDIDHIVPLANAWRSGARRWADERRRDFANDLQDSQLIAVSASFEPLEGRPGPGGVEAAEAGSVVSLLALVGAGEAALATRRHSV
jgi:hypothetical protein